MQMVAILKIKIMAMVIILKIKVMAMVAIFKIKIMAWCNFDRTQLDINLCKNKVGV